MQVERASETHAANVAAEGAIRCERSLQRVAAAVAAAALQVEAEWERVR
jgi:hypothetical protein